MRDNLLPDNRQYIKGELIPGPQSGGGSEGSPDGDSKDDVPFSLSRDCPGKTRSCPTELAKPQATTGADT
jgi:hypothetical protein